MSINIIKDTDFKVSETGQTVIFACFPGLGAETAEKLYRNDHTIGVYRYFPEFIDRWTSGENLTDEERTEYQAGLFYMINKAESDSRPYKFMLIDYQPFIQDILAKVGCKPILLVPSEDAMDHYISACASAAKGKTCGPELVKAQHMATTIPSVAAAYRRGAVDDNVPGDPADMVFMGNSHFPMFIGSLILSACNYPSSVITPGSSLDDEIQMRVRQYLSDLVTTWAYIGESMAVTLDSKGHIVCRSADPIDALDDYDDPSTNFDKLYDMAQKIGISVRETDSIAYGGGADFITLSREDAEVLYKLLCEVVEERGGEDVNALGMEGSLSYERLYDRISGMLYPAHEIMHFQKKDQ